MSRVADWSAEDAQLMDTTSLGSIVVITDDLSLETVVDDVLQRTGWTIHARPTA